MILISIIYLIIVSFWSIMLDCKIKITKNWSGDLSEFERDLGSDSLKGIYFSLLLFILRFGNIVFLIVSGFIITWYLPILLYATGFVLNIPIPFVIIIIAKFINRNKKNGMRNIHCKMSIAIINSIIIYIGLIITPILFIINWALLIIF